MTVLSIVQNACRELSLDVPAEVFASTNDIVVQLRGLLRRELHELARRANWTKLIKEQTFTTVAQDLQTGAVPSDFDYYLNDTMMNRTTSRVVLGPMSEVEWQREKAGPIYSSVHDAFRFRGGDILITPTPAAGDTIAFEYFTTNIAEDSGGTGKADFTADDDVAVLDEDIIELGLIWRFNRAKGFDYAEDFQNYEAAVAAAITRDGGAKRLDMTRSRVGQFYDVNIPEGNWS